MQEAHPAAFRVENIVPVLRVENMQASLQFYLNVLGFQQASWGTDDFTQVSRDRCGLYLCQRDQGRGGAWIWVGVEDVEKLHAELQTRGAKILLPPTNYPWAMEMRVEDPDGNVLRFGSEPK